MKNKRRFFIRCSALAVAVGTLCLTENVNAQSKAPEPPDDAPPVAKGSMAAVGAKPSKAELEKQKAGQGTTTTTTAAKPGTTAPAGALSAADREFMMMAGKDGMKEVHMGQMAVQQGQNAEVKKLGSTIVSDHTKANNELMEIATKRGVKLDQRHAMDKMSKKDMENFDQAWLGMMVNDHQKDIASFQRQAQGGTDPELKAFAKKTLPVLQKHLKLVQAAQKKLGSSATASTAANTR